MHTILAFSAAVATLSLFSSLPMYLGNCDGKTADAKGCTGHAGREPSFDTAMHLGIELYIALPHQGCIWPLVHCSAVL